MKKMVKKKKNNVKSSKKHKKPGLSDSIKAFLLVGLIVVFSALISCAVIMIHTSLKEDELVLQDDELPDDFIAEPAEKIASTASLVNVKPETPESNQLPSQNQENSNKQINPPVPPVPVTPDPVKPVIPVSTVIPPVINPVTPDRVVQNQGTLVFVIDDAGNNLRELEPFLSIPGPLTIAVLPGLPYSAEAARRIRAAGKEVILHQPMEAIGGQNPGPGAIYSNMSADEVRAVLSRNIAEVGPVAGMNNHQGSKITMDKNIMQIILAFCSEHNIYFLDSRTTAETVAGELASQMGIKFAERNVFIDNEQNKEAMLRYIAGGLTRAQRNNSAIMIGHTWSPELAPLLKEQFPLLMEQGYTIKTASDIVR
ncbi:MAG: divergent polysaccharide deacetylase family protein [Treponema sp.]|nr:divergent polysaccharide deacetylase family protein [Treponema sp.]